MIAMTKGHIVAINDDGTRASRSLLFKESDCFFCVQIEQEALLKMVSKTDQAWSKMVEYKTTSYLFDSFKPFKSISSMLSLAKLGSFTLTCSCEDKKWT